MRDSFKFHFASPALRRLRSFVCISFCGLRLSFLSTPFVTAVMLATPPLLPFRWLHLRHISLYTVAFSDIRRTLPPQSLSRLILYSGLSILPHLVRYLHYFLGTFMGHQYLDFTYHFLPCRSHYDWSFT